MDTKQAFSFCPLIIVLLLWFLAFAWLRLGSRQLGFCSAFTSASALMILGVLCH